MAIRAEPLHGFIAPGSTSSLAQDEPHIFMPTAQDIRHSVDQHERVTQALILNDFHFLLGED